MNNDKNIKSLKIRLHLVLKKIKKLTSIQDFTDRVAASFHLGMVGSGKNTNRLNKRKENALDDTIDKAKVVVKSYNDENYLLPRIKYTFRAIRNKYWRIGIRHLFPTNVRKKLTEVGQNILTTHTEVRINANLFGRLLFKGYSSMYCSHCLKVYVLLKNNPNREFNLAIECFLAYIHCHH